MNKNLLRLALFSAIGLQAGVASAASVAMIGACTTANFLSSYGNTVTNVSEHASLDGYDAVLIASDCAFLDAAALGTRLKSFVDAGHNVVIAEFSLQGPWAVAGGINAKGYNPFVIDPEVGGYKGTFVVGKNYAPTSQLFAGVDIGQVTTEYAGMVGLSEGATLVADWDDGRHAVAYNLVGGAAVIGLNLYPGDTYVNPDTQRLISNALNFAVPTGDVPEPASLCLMGLGIAGVLATRRRKPA